MKVQKQAGSPLLSHCQSAVDIKQISISTTFGNVQTSSQVFTGGRRQVNTSIKPFSLSPEHLTTVLIVLRSMSSPFRVHFTYVVIKR